VHRHDYILATTEGMYRPGGLSEARDAAASEAAIMELVKRFPGQVKRIADRNGHPQIQVRPSVKISHGQRTWWPDA